MWRPLLPASVRGSLPVASSSSLCDAADVVAVVAAAVVGGS